MSDKKEVSIKEYIDNTTIPIFNKVLQETNTNPMMVGMVDDSKPIQWLWQPHNYRLYFNFDKSTMKLPLYKDPTLEKLKVRLVGFDYQPHNYGSEHHFDNFYGCRIVIKKTQAEVTNKSHNKQWRLMTANDIDDIGVRINEVIERLDNQCIETLKKLIDLFGGSSDFKILKKRCKGEHGIHGIDFLDSIPEDMVIHDTIFNKPYRHKVQYKNPVYVKNTVTNFAIKNIAPEIADELSIIKEMVKGTLEINADTSKMIHDVIHTSKPAFAEFHSDIKVHNKALKGIEKNQREFNKSLKKFNIMLSQTSLSKWS